MKAITKATLAVILTVGTAAPLLYSQSAPAAEPTSTTQTQVDTTKAPGADSSKFAKPLIATGVGEGYKKMSPTEEILNFTPAKDADSLIKANPFLTDVKGLLKEDAASLDPGVDARPVTLSTAVSKSKDGKSDLFFVYYNGGNFCSDQGCFVTAYANDGSGYKSIGNFESNDDVRVDRAGGKLVITGPLASGVQSFTLDSKNMKLVEAGIKPQVFDNTAGGAAAPSAPNNAPAPATVPVAKPPSPVKP